MTNFNYSFKQVSTNRKTGPMPVTRTDKQSCPNSCPLKNNGCFAGLGRTNIHWKRLDNTGLSLDQLVKNIKKLPNGQTWRHNEAGDLPHIGDNETICGESLGKIVEANKRKNGFTYTHYSIDNLHNKNLLKLANNDGFTINVSCESLEQVDKAMEQGLPSVVIIDENMPKKFVTNNGNKVVTCPAQLKDSITCSTCKLCAKSYRKFAIGFIVHGVGKKKVKQVIAQQ